MKPFIKIGTRGSTLALYQTQLLQTHLEMVFPMVRFETVTIKTTGDLLRAGSVRRDNASKRIYTLEIEEALLAGDIDLAVHSAKDLSVPLPRGLKIGAVLEREDPRDCLITKSGKKMGELESGAVIGTSALRRRAQLVRMNHDLVLADLHGNVDTRVRKALAGDYDGIVLALAGLKRLDLDHHVSEIFPEETFLPAPGQGIIAVESRENDPDIDEFLVSVNHAPTMVQLTCERAFLERLDGGCQLPCGMTSVLSAKRIRVKGILLMPNGSRWVEREMEETAEDPEEIGKALAEIILEDGGRKILNEIQR